MSLTALPTRGVFIEGDCDYTQCLTRVDHGNDGWRAGPPPQAQVVFSGGLLQSRCGGYRHHTPRQEHMNRALLSPYVVQFYHCLIAWVEDDGWKTIHIDNFCGAPQVAEVERILRAAGISWEELT